MAGFAAGVSAWSKKRQAELLNQRREICLRLFRSIVYDTPVDEGTLRGNWQVSYTTPLTGRLGDRGPDEVMKDVENILANAKLPETIYFRNNLPYAYRIEYLGWSHTKAPQGMLRKNVARFREIARRAGGT